MRETWVWSPGREDSLEKRKATHSSILAWRIPWTVHSMGSQRVGHDWVIFTWLLDSKVCLKCKSHNKSQLTLKSLCRHCFGDLHFSKIARRNINNLRIADDSTLMEENKEELKNLLMRVKEESEKAGLKLNIQKTKIMASSPITSWQIDGETMEAVQILFSWGSESLWMVTAALKFKRPLLLGKKAMTNLDSILKSRDINLPTKVHLVKAMVFPVVMYGCELDH